MTGSLNAAIPLIIIGLVLLVLAVWLIMRMGQSTNVVGDESLKKDVLDEGAAHAHGDVQRPSPGLACGGVAYFNGSGRGQGAPARARPQLYAKKVWPGTLGGVRQALPVHLLYRA